jgi:hypothetical protein
MARTKYCILFGPFVSNQENKVVNSFDSRASWRGWKLVGVLFMLNVYEMNSKLLGNFPFPRKLASGANFTKLFRVVIYISAKQTQQDILLTTLMTITIFIILDKGDIAFN